MKLEGGWNRSWAHLLAGIWHLATHSTEILEAVPDGVDVGHSHEHDLTVGVVLCTHVRKAECKDILETGRQNRSGPSGQSSLGRAGHSRLELSVAWKSQYPFISSAIY